MFHLMRKYRKYILVVVIALTGFTFVIWGGYRSGGNNSQEDYEMEAVATVGSVPVYARDYTERLRQAAESQQKGDDERITFDKLQADGTAERLLNDMIDAALVSLNVSRVKVKLDRDYLVQRLKDSSDFKDESGKFSPTLWNTFVQNGRGRDWNAIYTMVEEQVARQLYITTATSSARVLDADVKKQFEDENTKLRVKFVAIEPAITPTDEQVKAQYDKDPTKYQIPEKRIADYAAISLAPACPALATEIVDRARKGEDFVALVKQYSKGPDAENGGDIGWLDRKPDLPSHQMCLNTLTAGSISDPVEGPGGWYIYKAEEEKVDAATGQNSVHVRRIQLKVVLDETEKQARTAKAEALAAKAKETGDLKAAAAEAGIEVKTSGLFSIESTAVDNVALEDVYPFRSKLSEVGADGISDVVAGPANLYVAKITKIEPPVPQPFEAVTARVREDAIKEIRKSEDYAKQVQATCDEVKAKAKSLAEVQAMFPNLALEVKESNDFGAKEFLYKDGLFIQSKDVFTVAEGKDVGAFFGPVKGFQAAQYFMEIVSRTAPTEEAWKTEWPKKEEEIRKSLLAEVQNKQLMDYVKDLRARSLGEIARDEKLLSQILAPPKQEEKTEEPRDLKFTPGARTQSDGDF